MSTSLSYSEKWIWVFLFILISGKFHLLLAINSNIYADSSIYILSHFSQTPEIMVLGPCQIKTHFPY